MFRSIFLIFFISASNHSTNAQEISDSIPLGNYVTIISSVDSLKTVSIAPYIHQIDSNAIVKHNIIKNESKPSGFGFSKFIVPTALISYGVAARLSESIRKIDVNVNDELYKKITWRTSVDDYLQFVPGVGVYGLSLMGVKSKNSYRDRSFIFASSYLMMTSSVQITKHATNVYRPDGSTDNAFPSGHTASAFICAHILHKEYKAVSPWIGVAGYVTAGTTGWLRMVNHRHWLSDVITGAGVGILCVEASYLLLPHFQNLMGDNKKKALSLAPSYNGKDVGLHCVMKF